MIPTTINEALDLETAPEYGYGQEYALQPWRLMEGKARISVLALGRAGGAASLVTEKEAMDAALRSRIGKPTVTWNGVFDVAWLIAAGHYNVVNQIPWFDGMLLWKWLENGVRKERMPKWSLADGAKRWLQDWPHLDKFLQLKKTESHAGVDRQYWELRGKMDAVVTGMIAERIWAKMPEVKRRAVCIEARCIVPVARSWVMGVPMDQNRVDDAAPGIAQEMREIEAKLGVTSKVLSSPKQLGDLLYNQWGLAVMPGFVSEKTGAPSTDKKALTYLADKDDRVLDLMRWRHLNTQYSKFIQSPLKAFRYLGSNVVHPAPKLFSTYTGRLTYSSKTDSKYQTGVALHQWQRDQVIRSLIKPPEGYTLVEFDASGQEDRLMAVISQDPMLLKIFRDDMDVHCYTASNITGQSYDYLMELKAADDPWLTGPNGMRMAGKVTNHSNKYRIGAAKMRITARVDYGMSIDLLTSKKWQTGFHRGFTGIKKYWGAAIHTAKTQGFASTPAGRTFLTPSGFFESKDERWGVESSSINFPIQGGGGDMKELAIAEMHDHFPDFLFAFDLHDGLFYYVKKGTPTARLHEAKAVLDNLDYKAAWDWDPGIPMVWDGELGPNWGDMTKLERYKEATV